MNLLRLREQVHDLRYLTQAGGEWGGKTWSERAFQRKVHSAGENPHFGGGRGRGGSQPKKEEAGDIAKTSTTPSRFRWKIS